MRYKEHGGIYKNYKLTGLKANLCKNSTTGGDPTCYSVKTVTDCKMAGCAIALSAYGSETTPSCPAGGPSNMDWTANLVWTANPTYADQCVVNSNNGVCASSTNTFSQTCSQDILKMGAMTM